MALVQSGGSSTSAVAGNVESFREVTVVSQNGNDSVWAGAGSGYVMGGDGNDTLLGGAGLDDLRGDAGTDALFGGPGLDYYAGGAGTDFFHVHHDGLERNGQEFVLDFGAGGERDWLVMSAAAREGTLIFDQGGYTWLASPVAGGGFHYVAVQGAGVSAATIAGDIIWL